MSTARQSASAGLDALTLSCGRADGCRIWTVGNRCHIDFDLSGGTILLGHKALDARLPGATSRSVLRDRVADQLRDLMPHAEKVLISESGHSAMRTALTIARTVTGKSRAITWENRPFSLTEMEDLAAVIVNPLGMTGEQAESAQRVASAFGALLIFDEVDSGFRIDEAGAAGRLSISPDLSVLGPGLANGQPIGAVAGAAGLLVATPRGEVDEPSDASLSSASATLEKLAQQPVASAIRAMGTHLMADLSARAARQDLGSLFELRGDPCLPSVRFDSPRAEGAWLSALAQRGIILFGAHGLSPVHGEAELELLIEAYESVMQLAHEGKLGTKVPLDWIKTTSGAAV